jgi:predicted helicase
MDRLRWPTKPSDVNGWRQQWAGAFTSGHREPIRTAKDLSESLAALAARTRDLVLEVLKYERSDGPLHRLFESFQKVLIHDLKEHGFADMVAQTVAYGLFSARCTGQEILGLAHLEAMVPNTNRFLKELFAELASISGHKKGQINFDDIGLSEMVDLLKNTNIEAVLEDFGRQTGGGKEDPVVHFYETFLNVYDKEQKVQRGVFYTPKPVVSFIVRSVHEILQKEFVLADGLADTTTWGELTERKVGLQIPAGVKRDAPFVQILDPATGTGTFLEEVIEVVHKTMTGKWSKQGKTAKQILASWNEYVPKHLLPRLHGFELMMAPYSVAHMKLGLKLRQTGYDFTSNQQLRVYLTNTLEPPEQGNRKLGFLPDFLSHESMQADSVKDSRLITVLLGNPPYSKMSANVTEPAIALVEPFRYVDGKRITEKGALALELNLQDDYVKFFGAMMQYAKRTPYFVGSYISNFRYLDSSSLRGFRKYLLDHFTDVDVLNLGGHLANASELDCADDNVFDIVQGVAIVIVRRSAASGEKAGTVGLRRIFGDRETKYDSLSKKTMQSWEHVPLKPSSPLYKFSDDANSLDEVYRGFPKLDEMFPINSGSIITSRDNLTIDRDPNALLRKIRRFALSPKGDKQIQEEIGFSAKAKWDVEGCKRALNSAGVSKKFIRRILYRPFDMRNIYYVTSLLDTPSRPVCEMIGEINLVLLTPKVKTTGFFNHALVSRVPAEKKSCSHDRATQMFPLFDRRIGRSLDGTDTGLNLSHQYVADFRLRLGKNLPADQLSGQAIFHYIYAVLYSPTYRKLCGSLLKDDYPRIPFASDVSLFVSLSQKGADLVALHLLEEDYPDATWNQAAAKSKNPFSDDRLHLVSRTVDLSVDAGFPRFSDRTVWLSDRQGIKPVADEVWEFLLGGYQVCEKWLKDLRGEVLTGDDLRTYMRIVVALTRTLVIMDEIDGTIRKHGGLDSIAWLQE